MGKHSQRISDRFQLDLSSAWIDWFDLQMPNLNLPGCFRLPVDIEELCKANPKPIWAGFMLPDTLPLLSNGYGDWICVRITQANHLGELIHWYHGGGDWIPVGGSPAEAALHDLVDLLRPVRKQMLRGAVETARPQSPAVQASAQSIHAMVESLLSFRTELRFDDLAKLMHAIARADHRGALDELMRLGISTEAATCDRIEQIIQQSYVGERSSLTGLSLDCCHEIERLCMLVAQRRQDLGWLFSLLGHCQFRRDEKDQALASFFAGRFASAFSDQSVRLHLQHFDKHFGKHCIAQLIANKHLLTPQQLSDDYLSIFVESGEANWVAKTQKYWLDLAGQASAKGDPADTYHCAYLAGWDLGAANMASYRRILELLQQAAAAAGWHARAAVARAHLNCLG